jgi:hypothetical protein
MDEGTLHMAKAMVNMSIEEEQTYADIAKSDMTVLGKVKMQDKLLRYCTALRLPWVAAARVTSCTCGIPRLHDFSRGYR